MGVQLGNSTLGMEGWLGVSEKLKSCNPTRCLTSRFQLWITTLKLKCCNPGQRVEILGGVNLGIHFWGWRVGWECLKSCNPNRCLPSRFQLWITTLKLKCFNPGQGVEILGGVNLGIQLNSIDLNRQSMKFYKFE